MARATLRDQFLTLLRVPLDVGESRQEQILQIRLAKLGHEHKCDRCSGAGGWQGWPGFTCFKCGGACRLPIKLSKRLLADVEADVASGKLDVYLADLAAKREEKRQVDALR